MVRPLQLVLMLLLLSVAGRPCGVAAQDDPAAWLRPFGDNIHHWQSKLGDDRYPRYAADQVREIAENVLLHQRDNGGWPPNWDPARIIPDAERTEIERQRADKDTSLDNRTSYTHLTYLAHAYSHTGDERRLAGCLRGIEFLLAAETPRGLWPHSYPSQRGYHPHITFMDDVTIGALRTVEKIGLGQPPFEFVPQPLRERCQQAHERGRELLLALQVRDPEGRLTVWAGQYDEQTLLPCQGRTFEPPSLVSGESVGVVRYLMSTDRSDPKVQAAIDGAVEWFRRSAIRGLRIDRVPIDPLRFPNHTAKFDAIEVADPAAPPVWARFYDLVTNEPLMANRDGTIVHRLADVEIERRTGYAWYGGFATGLLEKQYPAWKRQQE